MLLPAVERQHDFVMTFLSEVNYSWLKPQTHCADDIAISAAFCSNAQTTVIRGNEDDFRLMCAQRCLESGSAHTSSADPNKPAGLDQNLPISLLT